MDVKLTVRVPRELIFNAKCYAQRHDTTLTRLILNYLHRIPVEEPDLANSPLVRELTGIISPDLSNQRWCRLRRQQSHWPGSRANGSR